MRSSRRGQARPSRTHVSRRVKLTHAAPLLPLRRRHLDVASAYASSRSRGHRLASDGACAGAPQPHGCLVTLLPYRYRRVPVTLVCPLHCAAPLARSAVAREAGPPSPRH